MPKVAVIISAAAALLLASCSGEDGVVLVDVCTPVEAADPFLNGSRLRISSTGDVTSSVSFDLATGDHYEERAVFPMGSTIGMVVEVLNAGDVPVARGLTEEVEVRSLTRVCACLTLLVDSEMEYCRDVGCVYESEEDRCIFYRLP